MRIASITFLSSGALLFALSSKCRDTSESGECMIRIGGPQASGVTRNGEHVNFSFLGRVVIRRYQQLVGVLFHYLHFGTLLIVITPCFPEERHGRNLFSRRSGERAAFVDTDGTAADHAGIDLVFGGVIDYGTFVRSLETQRVFNIGTCRGGIFSVRFVKIAAVVEIRIIPV